MHRSDAILPGSNPETHRMLRRFNCISRAFPLPLDRSHCRGLMTHRCRGPSCSDCLKKSLQLQCRHCRQSLQSLWAVFAVIAAARTCRCRMQSRCHIIAGSLRGGQHSICHAARQRPEIPLKKYAMAGWVTSRPDDNFATEVALRLSPH
jgi:hypothetical protein